MAGTNLADYGGIVQDVGNAVSDLFGSQGNAAQANDFQGAATLATQNAQLTAASTRIQETQTARAVSQSLGTQQADVAGAGFTKSGSALDLLKSSAQQGALAKSLVNIQGAITENSYAAQAGAYSGEAAAANEASNAGQVSAIASLGGALLKGGQLLSQGQTTFGSGATTVASDGAIDSTSGVLEPGVTGVDAFGANVTAPTNLTQISGTATGLPSVESQLPITSNLGNLVQSQADLNTLATTTTNTTAVDTSALDVGSSVSTDLAGIGDFLSGAADTVVAGAGDALAAAAAGAAAVGDAVAGAAASVGDFIVDALPALASVICTALYQYNHIPKKIWLAAQYYGSTMNKEVFDGYTFWATPVANKIKKSWSFAYQAKRIFTPAIYEMAFEMGEPSVKSTLRGRVTLKLLFGLSWLCGKFLKLKGGRRAIA